MWAPLIAVSLLAAADPAPGPPAADAIPAGKLGDAIRLGRAIFDETNTHPLTRRHVRNALTCASCHPGSGASPGAPTLRGAATAYPAWSPREKAVLTLEDRILNCFMRSMNGTRPPNGSAPAVALTTYLTWLSTGMPVGMNPRYPRGPFAVEKVAVFPDEVDVPHGRALFATRCAACHGDDGQGTQAAPPVWGARSYNAGAGLADVEKLAGWVKVTMPPGDTTLTEKEAVDVAAFVNSQPRPEFHLKDHLPRGSTYNAQVRDEVVRAPTWPPRD